MCRKVLLMGDTGESLPLKADKYLCWRGDREQAACHRASFDKYQVSLSALCLRRNVSNLLNI